MPTTPDEWRAKLQEWGMANRLTLSDKAFDPHALADPEANRALPRYYETGKWPAADHVTCFVNANGEPGAITCEPSPSSELFDLQTLSRRLGLTIHVPPNPRGSLLAPGWATFIAITRAGRGRVRWLQEQLD